MSRGILRIKVLGDTSGVDKALGGIGWAKFTGAAALASAAVVAAMGAIGAASVKAAASFEKEMSRVKANANGTAAEMQQLEKTVIQLGKDTVFSAGQTAQAANELVKAGMSVGDTIGALPGMLALASAGELDVAAAAEITANQLSVFNLAAEDAGRVADTLALAANRSTTEVSLMGDSLAMVGAVAAQAGLTLQETSAALALLANNGLKGSDAGTSLKQTFMQLMGPSEKAADLMDSIGFSAYDAGGKMKDMDVIIGDLEVATRDMTDEERDFALATIFGSDAVRAVNILLKEGSANFRDMTAAVSETGAAAKIAETKMDNLAGSWEQFKGSLETAAIAVGNTGLGGIRDVVDELTEQTNEFLEAWESMTGSKAWQAGGFEIKLDLASETVVSQLKALWKKAAESLSEVNWEGVGTTVGDAIATATVDALSVMGPVAVDVALQVTWGTAKGAAKGATIGVATWAAELRESMFVGGWENDVREIAREDGIKLGQAYAKWLASTSDEWIYGITKPTEQQAFNVKRMLGLDFTEAEIKRAIELGFDEKLAAQLVADQAARIATETKAQIQGRDDIDWGKVLFDPTKDVTENLVDYMGLSPQVVEATNNMTNAVGDLGETVEQEVNPYLDLMIGIFDEMIGPADAWTEAINRSKQAAEEAGKQYQVGKDTLVSFLEEMQNQISAWENFQSNLEKLAKEWGPEFGTAVIAEAAEVGPDFVAALVGSDDPALVKKSLSALATLIQQDPADLASKLEEWSRGVGASAGAAMARAWSNAFGANASMPSADVVKAWNSINRPTGYSKGTITTGPELALIGEAGPEVVIPLSNPDRARELLLMSGLVRPMATGGISGYYDEWGSYHEQVKSHVDSARNNSFQGGYYDEYGQYRQTHYRPAAPERDLLAQPGFSREQLQLIIDMLGEDRLSAAYGNIEAIGTLLGVAQRKQVSEYYASNSGTYGASDLGAPGSGADDMRATLELILGGVTVIADNSEVLVDRADSPRTITIPVYGSENLDAGKQIANLLAGVL